AGAAYTWIDDAEKDALLREVAPARVQHPGSALDILRCDPMGDVDQRNAWGDAEYDPFHDTDIAVDGTEVRQQCDERYVWHVRCSSQNPSQEAPRLQAGEECGAAWRRRQPTNDNTTQL